MTITPEELKKMRQCTAFDMPADVQIRLFDHIDAQAERISELEGALNIASASFSNERVIDDEARKELSALADIAGNSAAEIKRLKGELEDLKDKNYRDEFIDVCRTIGHITKLLGIAEDEVTGHPSQIFDVIDEVLRLNNGGNVSNGK